MGNKMDAERIARARKRNDRQQNPQRIRHDRDISDLMDALDDLEEVQSQLNSSESIRLAEKKILIEEIEKHTGTKRQLGEARRALDLIANAGEGSLQNCKMIARARARRGG